MVNTISPTAELSAATQVNYWEAINQVISDAVISVLADATVEYCNPAACKLFQLDWPQSKPISVFDLFNKFHTLLPISPTCFENFAELKASQREIYDSGTQLCLHWHVIPTQAMLSDSTSLILLAKPIASDGVIADHLRGLINCIPGSVYWKDKDGVYLGCNQFMLEKSGIRTIDSIVGRTDQELWPMNAPALRANDMHVIMTGETLSKEEIVQIPDGTAMCFASVKMPLRNQNGAVIGVICNSLDITKQKRTEQALANAKAEAELANQTKAAFMQNMEHDLRTPFSGLYGLTQLLWKRESDPEKKELLSLATHSAKELLETCNSILALSRKGDCGTEVAQRVFDLHHLVQRVVDIEMPPAYLKNLKLSLSCDPAVPRWMIGDEHRVFRILVNLISNAVKFTESGSVKLRVKLLSHKAKQALLEFQIEDTGIGLGKQKQAQIKALLTSKIPLKQDKLKQFGLGLVNVKQFIHDLRGSINVDSKQDVGTVFTCQIPLRIHTQPKRTEIAATTAS